MSEHNLFQQRTASLSRRSFSRHLSSGTKWKMDRTATVTILILLLCAIAAQGIPIPGAEGRCKCIQTSSNIIHPKFIRSLKYVPSGSHCERAEMIVTLKNERKVCVDPDAKWLHALIRAMKGGKKHK